MDEVLASYGARLMNICSQAQGECSIALECVSLLLSKPSPAAAQTTISPYLKQNVPLGSLGGDIVQTTQKSEMDKYNESLVTLGWRTESLNGVAGSILKSATKLEDEIGKETRYWEEVLKVKDKGWSLHKLPREKHTLGVRYGFAEGMVLIRSWGGPELIEHSIARLSRQRSCCLAAQ